MNIKKETAGRNGYRIILASQSPRRRELMRLTGFCFEVMVSDAEERITHSDPARVTEELSRQKAKAVADMLPREKVIVIGADTVVSLKNQILGKPSDTEDARRMITALQGKTHAVHTGITLLVKGDEGECCRTFSEETKVEVAAMAEEEIEEYIATEEPYDKAGAYGIQGTFARFVKGIQGDYYNVVGLPVQRLYAEIRAILLNHGKIERG